MTVQVHFFEYPCFLRSNKVLLQLAIEISNRSAPPTCNMGVVVVPGPSARLPAKGLGGGVWDKIMGVVTLFYTYTCLCDCVCLSSCSELPERSKKQSLLWLRWYVCV